MKSIPIALAPVLLLAACGGSDGDGGTPADVPAEQAEPAEDATPAADATTFSGELEDGSVLTVRLDVDESDPIVAPFVAFRAEAGATDPVVWIIGSLEAPADFDDALGPPTGRFLTFLPDGADLVADDATNPKSTFACSELDDWFGTPTGDAGVTLNERYIEIVNDSCAGQTLGVVGAVGATTDYAMVVEASELPEFAELYAGLLTRLAPVG